MARLIGLNGNVIGKLGNTVGYMRRGLNIGRMYNPEVTNPNTLRQQVSRENFRQALRIARATKPIVLMGYSGVKPTYEVQAMVGVNIKYGNIDVQPNLSFEEDPSSILVADGPLYIPLLGSVEVSTPSTVRMQVGPNTVSPSNLLIDGVTPIGCFVMVGAWCREYGESRLAPIAYVHPDGTVEAINDYSVSLPPAWSGTKVCVYAFCKQAPESMNSVDTTTMPPRIRFAASPSVYCGEVTVA